METRGKVSVEEERGWKIYRKVRSEGNREVFMATHNSCPLLKLPLGNGLRRLVRNLSKFPGRVIYSQPGSNHLWRACVSLITSSY